jgi:hypothetical protein
MIKIFLRNIYVDSSFIFKNQSKKYFYLEKTFCTNSNKYNECNTYKSMNIIDPNEEILKFYKKYLDDNYLITRHFRIQISNGRNFKYYYK